MTNGPDMYPEEAGDQQERGPADSIPTTRTSKLAAMVASSAVMPDRVGSHGDDQPVLPAEPGDTTRPAHVTAEDEAAPARIESPPANVGPALERADPATRPEWYSLLIRPDLLDPSATRFLRRADTTASTPVPEPASAIETPSAASEVVESANPVQPADQRPEATRTAESSEPAQLAAAAAIGGVLNAPADEVVPMSTDVTDVDAELMPDSSVVSQTVRTPHGDPETSTPSLAPPDAPQIKSTGDVVNRSVFSGPLPPYNGEIGSVVVHHEPPVAARVDEPEPAEPILSSEVKEELVRLQALDRARLELNLGVSTNTVFRRALSASGSPITVIRMYDYDVHAPANEIKGRPQDHPDTRAAALYYASLVRAEAAQIDPDTYGRDRKEAAAMHRWARATLGEPMRQHPSYVADAIADLDEGQANAWQVATIATAIHPELGPRYGLLRSDAARASAADALVRQVVKQNEDNAEISQAFVLPASVTGLFTRQQAAPLHRAIARVQAETAIYNFTTDSPACPEPIIKAAQLRLATALTGEEYEQFGWRSYKSSGASLVNTPEYVEAQDALSRGDLIDVRTLWQRATRQGRR